MIILQFNLFLTPHNALLIVDFEGLRHYFTDLGFAIFLHQLSSDRDEALKTTLGQFTEVKELKESTTAYLFLLLLMLGIPLLSQGFISCHIFHDRVVHAKCEE